MLTIWSCAIRPLPSVNGIVNTSGKVPAASAAVKVGAVQLYSSGSTLIHGYFASNSLIWRFSASTAAWVAPGRRTPTVIVTSSFPAFGSVLGATAPEEAAGALAGGLDVVEDPQRGDEHRQHRHEGDGREPSWVGRLIGRPLAFPCIISGPRWIAFPRRSTRCAGRHSLLLIPLPLSATRATGRKSRDRSAATPTHRVAGLLRRDRRLSEGPRSRPGARSRNRTGS